jgi:glyoxylase-like metal-dependent hydrolase (beta-lactamase superfamily II)
MKSLPDTLQLIERGWLSSNHVVFADDDVPTVVDTGYVTEGDGMQRLGRIVNTHLHSDHAGGKGLSRPDKPPRGLGW